MSLLIVGVPFATSSIKFACYNGSLNPSAEFVCSANTWMQIVGVFDHTNNFLYAYRNGVLQTTSAMNIGGTISNSSTLNIARRANSVGGGTGYFTGKVGICRIYSSLLTASDIQQNFNANRNLFGI